MVKTQERPLSPHNPGTPDVDISPLRLKGRIDARRGYGESISPFRGYAKIEWFLGWYDERLRRFWKR